MIKNFCIRLNAVIEKFMPLLTISGVAVGFLLNKRVSGFAPVVTWLFAFMTLTGALTMNIGDFVKVIRKPFPIFVFLIAFHIIIPTMVWFTVSFVFGGNKDFIAGFMLLYSIPTAVVGFMWTSIYKGNGPLALTLILIDTILAPFLTPATVSFFMNEQIQIDGMGMFVSLVWMVVIPSILGILINQVSSAKIPQITVPYIKPFSKIALWFVIIINGSRVAGSVTSFEPIFILLILLCICISFCGFVVGMISAKITKTAKEDSVSIMFSVGLRNISASLVLALNFFEPRAALPVIISIVFQQTLAALAGILFVKNKRLKDSA